MDSFIVASWYAEYLARLYLRIRIEPNTRCVQRLCLRNASPALGDVQPKKGGVRWWSEVGRCALVAEVIDRTENRK